jgi:hypothetical protein
MLLIKKQKPGALIIKKAFSKLKLTQQFQQFTTKYIQC